jgi:hypothetical protein
MAELAEEEQYQAYAVITVPQHPCEECGVRFDKHQPGKWKHPWRPGRLTDDHFPKGHPARTDTVKDEVS